MSTYILMKILEHTPSNYDRGIRLLTRGKLEESYDRLATSIKKGDRVLDIGCGTGALTLRAAGLGARVKGIDINPRLLEIARARAKTGHFEPAPEFLEMGVAELGGEKDESYDVVMSGLCFSELSQAEFNFALQQIKRILKPGGLLLVADEVRPRQIWRRIILVPLRQLFKLIVYLITGTTTRAIHNLPAKIKNEGFEIVSLKGSKSGTFLELKAKKPETAGRKKK